MEIQAFLEWFLLSDSILTQAMKIQAEDLPK